MVNGATSIEQLEQNITATEVRLTQEELEACDRMWEKLHPPRIYYGR